MRTVGGTAVGLAAVFVVLGCTAVPVTQRRAFIVTTEELERALGKEAYRQVLAQGGVSRNHRWQALLERVGKRIAAAAGRPDYEWRFTVFEGRTPNAFAFPAGKVGVTTAMMGVVDNEAQLAAVVAHEVAHATARHGGGSGSPPPSGPGWASRCCGRSSKGLRPTTRSGCSRLWGWG